MKKLVLEFKGTNKEFAKWLEEQTIKKIIELDKKGELTEQEHDELIKLLGIYDINYIRHYYKNLY